MEEQHFPSRSDRHKNEKLKKEKVKKEKPVAEPNPNAAVAKLPDEFAKLREAKK